ncbi:putative Mutator protein [Panicum miliaceum]|uniref:Mutator protein n=1 Tax=Panicum miliaceum TaxID=4540 RepID=A0A3L6RXA3_PANMI|nr:putative Mutator protein [Panicum miliaceum]
MIEPGNTFRVIVRCDKYYASLDYGFLEIAEEEHEIWFDRRNGYSLDKFVKDMTGKMIWGRTHTLIIWGVNIDNGSEWKLTNNEATNDGDIFALVDGDKVFEAMGFKEAGERATTEATKEYAIPVIPTDIQDDMRVVGLWTAY